MMRTQGHLFLQAEKTNLLNWRQARSGAWKMLRDLLNDFEYRTSDQAVPVTLSPWACMVLAEP